MQIDKLFLLIQKKEKKKKKEFIYFMEKFIDIILEEMQKLY